MSAAIGLQILRCLAPPKPELPTTGGVVSDEDSYSPESWERVKREASLFSAKGGCIATLRPDSSAAQLTGTGPTSSTAMHELARKLDDWKAQDSRL